MSTEGIEPRVPAAEHAVLFETATALIVEAATPAIALVRGPDFVFEYVNPAYQAIAPRKDILGKTVAEVWTELAPQMIPLLRRVVADGSWLDARERRILLRRSDGVAERYYHFTYERLAIRAGQDPAVLAVGSDTTELVRMRLRAELLQDVTAGLSSATTSADIGRVALKTAAFHLGASRASIWIRRGTRLELRFDHRSGGMARRRDASIALDAPLPAAEAVRTGSSVWLESRDEARRRYPRFVEARRTRLAEAWIVSPLRVGDAPAFGAIAFAFLTARSFEEADRALCTSIADQCALALERARLFEAEQRARAEAERLSSLQEKLCGVVGHELRTPLSAIRLAAHLALERGELGARDLTALHRITASASRIREIIRNLLDFARVRQVGGIPLQLHPARIDSIVATAVREIRDAYPERIIDVDVTGEGEGTWDASRLEQVVSNLVCNALQHSGKGARVKVSAKGDRDDVTVQVHNDGSVIPPDVRSKLFDPFQHGAGSGSVGLGLFIVRQIVEGHEGGIEVRSNATEGTTFSIRLPRRSARDREGPHDRGGGPELTRAVVREPPARSGVRTDEGRHTEER